MRRAAPLLACVLCAGCAEMTPASQPVSAASAPTSAPASQPTRDPNALFAEALKERSADKFEQVIALDPTHCFAYINAGTLRQDRALAYYQQATAYCPEAYAALSAHALQQGDLPAASRWAQEGIGKHPQHIELRHRYSEALIAQGRYADAERQALGVLKIDEKNAWAMLNLSRAYYGQKKFELARLAVDNARAIDPDRGEIYHQLGVLLLHKNERPQALAAFKKATELRPDLAASQINLAQLLGEAGDFEGALSAAQAAIKQAPQSKKARLALANAYRGVMRFAEAEQGYRALGTDTDALYNLGMLYLDAELPGVTTEDRLARAILTFSALPKQTSEVMSHIQQAKRQLEAEKKRKARKMK